jgi:hypothetical protein
MVQVSSKLALATAALLALPAAAPAKDPPGSYLYVWAGDADERDSDFLAVVDARQSSRDYGRVIATLPVGAKALMPHHVEYDAPPDDRLFANGWVSGRTFIIDLSDPRAPKLAGQFKGAGGYSYPHSFARLPNGNVLATFQSIGDKYAPPGGLVELDRDGRMVRSAPSATPDIPTATNWPYSLAVAPRADRVVVTLTDMGMGPGWTSPETNHVQIWSASDLKLRASVPLPAAPEGKVHVYPAEPRVLADGTVYVNTFTCGLYRIDGLASASPSAAFVHAFPGGPGEHDMCAVPVVVGHHWIQTVGAINGLVVLDVADPARPREVSRLSLPHTLHVPHWTAADRANGRIAVTGMRDSWLAMLRFDPRTGTLTPDDRFGIHGAVQFDRASWPHGATGKALVHGAVFSR